MKRPIRDWVLLGVMVLAAAIEIFATVMALILSE